MASPSCYSLSHILIFWGQLKIDLFASTFTSHCQHYCILDNPLPLGALVEHFQSSLEVLGELCIPFSCVSSISCIKFLAEHVTSQNSPLILIVGLRSLVFSSGIHTSLVAHDKKSC